MAFLLLHNYTDFIFKILRLYNRENKRYNKEQYYLK